MLKCNTLAGSLSKLALKVGWPCNLNCTGFFQDGALSLCIAFFITQDQVSKDKALQTVANLSSAQIVSASVMKPQTPFPPTVRVRHKHTCTHICSFLVYLLAASNTICPLSLLSLLFSFGLALCQDSLDILRSEYHWQISWFCLFNIGDSLMLKMVQLLIFKLLLLFFTASSPFHSHHTLHYQPLSLHLSVSLNTVSLFWVIRSDYCYVYCVFLV